MYGAVRQVRLSFDTSIIGYVRGSSGLTNIEE
jgi:hypothetical protein